LCRINELGSAEDAATELLVAGTDDAYSTA